MTYIIVLKVKKFGEDRLKRFWDIYQKPSGGHFAPPPSQNKVNMTDILAVKERRHLVANWLKGVISAVESLSFLHTNPFVQLPPFMYANKFVNFLSVDNRQYSF